MKRATTSDTAEIEALEQQLVDGIKAKDAGRSNCRQTNEHDLDAVPPKKVF